MQQSAQTMNTPYPGYYDMLFEIISCLKSHLSDATATVEKTEDLFNAASTNGHPDYFADFSAEHNLNHRQQVMLAAALVAYTHPSFYFILSAGLKARGDNSLGAYNDNQTDIVYPTIQTLQVVLQGTDYQGAMNAGSEILEDPLFKQGVLKATSLPGVLIKNNHLNHVVTVGDDYLTYFFTGEYCSPKFSADFPAQKITTKLGWSDLVLDPATLSQIKEITAWQKHRDVVLNQWNLQKMLSPGYKVLFYGPPGTGKSLTAALMGQELKVDVFRIDLSLVVSKYIGETEKNLSALFDRAANKNWILFFDESDALFGTRTGVNDAHDRYANQEVSYLLQRVENYNGIIILASNLKGNMDRAFSRRFQSMIKFKIPDAEQRTRLWANSFSQATVLENGFPLHDLAKTYELAGGSIINVGQYASLKAAERGDNIILNNDVKTGVIRELSKEGKTP